MNDELIKFMKKFNRIRKASGGKWYTVAGIVDDELIQIKAFGTWIQILETDTFKSGSPMELTVSGCNEYLVKALTRLS